MAVIVQPVLPIKHKSIFKSRWIALLWAGGIIWSAVDFAGNRQQNNINSTGGNAAAVSDSETRATQDAVNAFDAAGG